MISGEVFAIHVVEQEMKKAFHSGLIAEAAQFLVGMGASAPGDSSILPVTYNFTGGWLSQQGSLSSVGSEQ